MSDWLLIATPIVIGLVAIVKGCSVYLQKVRAKAEWKGAVDADRTSFKEFMEEVRTDIKKILDRLPPATAAGSSPITLTDLGEKISREIGAKTWAADTADKIKESTKNMQPYEIQEFCKEFVNLRHKFPEELDLLIKNSAYENAVKREQVLNVLAIELRDRLLEIQNLGH